LSATGILVVQSNSNLILFPDMKKQTYLFERNEKTLKYVYIDPNLIAAYHVFDLEVNKEQTVGKIRIVIVDNYYSYPEIWMIEVTVNGK